MLSLTELPSLESLHGLENLTTVGDQVLIANNAQLSSLAALSNLTEINADGYQPYPGQPTLQIYNNASLPACWVWQVEAQTGVDCQSYSGGPGWSECSGNHGQGSCGTLPEGFECVPGATGPGVYDGSIYIDSWSGSSDILSNLGGVTCITGDLFVNYRPDVTSLAGLSGLQQIGGSLGISMLPSLVNLDGLEDLTTIGRQVTISYNEQLSNLAALSNLTEINAYAGPYPTGQALRIQDNADLPACWVWQIEAQTGVECQQYGYPTVTDCGGNHGQGSCGTLPEGFECVPGATGPGVYDGSIYIDSWSGSSDILSNLGGVTCITGDLFVNYRPDVTSLAGLSGLQQIGGSLGISMLPSLVNLDGLEDLTTIGREVTISYNEQLSNLEALANLTEINAYAGPYPTGQALRIQDNADLPACWVWQIEAQTGVECQQYGYPTVTDCGGNLGQGSCGTLPEGFECVPGATGPGVYDGNIYIESWSGSSDILSNLGGVTCITGDLFVSSRPEVTSLASLSGLEQIGGSLGIYMLPSLVDLDGLESLTTIGREVTISYNEQLSNLAALSNLTEINAYAGPYPTGQALRIQDNADLPACWVWQIEAQTGVECQQYGYPTTTDCSGNLGQGSCGELPEGFECVPGATGPGVYDGNIYIDSWSGSSDILSNLGGVTCITGDLFVNYRPEVTSLAGLSGLQQIGGSLGISMLPSLVDLDGLGDLTTIGRQVTISYNEQLSNLAALSNLTEINAYAGPYPESALSISGNQSLPACWVTIIEDQTDVTCGSQYQSCVDNNGTGTCEP